MTNEFKRVQVFRWRTKDGREYLWDVNAALEAVSLNPPPTITLGSRLMMDAIAKNDQANQITMAECAGCNLDNPILIIESPPELRDDGGTHVIIDGWHRIAKAVMVGQSSIEAYRFTHEQAQQFRLQ